MGPDATYFRKHRDMTRHVYLVDPINLMVVNGRMPNLEMLRGDSEYTMDRDGNVWAINWRK